MRMLNLEFEIMPADIDEKYLKHEAAPAHAQRLAREKALVIAEQHPEALVVGSDTVVVIDRSVLGKPKSEADAVKMLMRLQGRVHRVATGVAVAQGAACVAETEIDPMPLGTYATYAPKPDRYLTPRATRACATRSRAPFSSGASAIMRRIGSVPEALRCSHRLSCGQARRRPS